MIKNMERDFLNLGMELLLKGIGKTVNYKDNK